MNNIVNFKEIPPGNGKDDAQDEFELFVRDLLVALGYDIVKEPARGGDDGIDLVVREYSYGPMGKNSRLVGVSCKHNAHSNKAVGREDEKFNLSVADAFGFKVFYAFYSTIASESLGRTLANLGKKLDEVKVFDHSLISVLLRENDASLRVFRDYFPVSFGGYHLCNRGSGIYRSPPVMECDFCSNNVISRFEGWFYFVSQYVVEDNGCKHRDFIKLSVRCEAHSNVESFPLDVPGLDLSRSDIDIDRCSVLSMTEPRVYIKRLLHYMDGLCTGSYRMPLPFYRQFRRMNNGMFYFVSRKVDVDHEGRMLDAFNPIDLLRSD